jgi:hypothetical protein
MEKRLFAAITPIADPCSPKAKLKRVGLSR